MLNRESSLCFNDLLLMADSILESRSIILPVFYDVNTSGFGWTRGADRVYHRTLDIVEEKKSLYLQTNKEKPQYDSKCPEKWRNALSVVAESNSFELNSFNCVERQFGEKVVQKVLKKVRKTPLNIAKYPINLDERVTAVEKIVLLQQQSWKVRVAGIVGGLGGVGKMSVSEIFFNCHISNYDQFWFLCLSSSHEALIVLDDVDHIDHLDALYSLL